MATDVKCTIYDQSAHPTELAYALERVKEEHTALRCKVGELETALAAARNFNKRIMAQKLIEMAEEFLIECQAHSRWEEKELLPFVSAYYRSHGGPDIAVSVWMMEKDHELGFEFLRLFIQKAKCLSADFDEEKWNKAAVNLLQACYIFKDHFELEEQILFSPAFRVLDDIDYLFS